MQELSGQGCLASVIGKELVAGRCKGPKPDRKCHDSETAAFFLVFSASDFSLALSTVS